MSQPNNYGFGEEAALLKAPMLVLVCGADPGQSLESRAGRSSGLARGGGGDLLRSLP